MLCLLCVAIFLFASGMLTCFHFCFEELAPQETRPKNLRGAPLLRTAVTPLNTFFTARVGVAGVNLRRCVGMAAFRRWDGVD